MDTAIKRAIAHRSRMNRIPSVDHIAIIKCRSERAVAFTVNFQDMSSFRVEVSDRRVEVSPAP